MARRRAGFSQEELGALACLHRMPSELAAQINAIARAEGVSISEAMKAAAYRYIAQRKADPKFQEQLSKRLKEDKEVMEALAESSDP